MLWILRQRFGSESFRCSWCVDILLTFVYSHTMTFVLLVRRLTLFFFARWTITISWLSDFLGFFIYSRFKRTWFKLSFYLFESLQIFFISHHTMQKIKLLVSIICLLFTCIIRYAIFIDIKFFSNNFSVTLNNNSDDFKES